MKKYIILLILPLITVSCSYEKKLKRANKKIERLTKRFPELLEKDTLYDTFNIITPEIKYDTAFIDVPGDTTIITRDKLEIKYVRIGDSVFIEGKCKGDTIVQTVEIPYEKIVYKKEGFLDKLIKYIKKSIIWVIILIVVIYILKYLFKHIKPFSN
jgi:hypothetical protein